VNIVTSWTATFSLLFFWRWKKINFVCARKRLKPIKTFISGLYSARELCSCMYVCPGSNSFRNWTYLNVTVQRVWMSQWYPSRAIVNSAEFSHSTVFVLWRLGSEPYDCSCYCYRMKTDKNQFLRLFNLSIALRCGHSCVLWYGYITDWKWKIWKCLELLKFVVTNTDSFQNLPWEREVMNI